MHSLATCELAQAIYTDRTERRRQSFEHRPPRRSRWRGRRANGGTP
jgi:hypothetical protein